MNGMPASDSMTDEELVVRSRGGESLADEILYNRYKYVVRMKARPYFLVGADREDLLQEGMIGLYNAVRDYDASKNAAFRTFADICITRHIITAVKTATRGKHAPLNSYVSIYEPAADDSPRMMLDVMAVKGAPDPEESYIQREFADNLMGGIARSLSPLEAQVLPLFLDGRSYHEIASMLGRSVKSVDNSLQRIKKKVEQLLAEDTIVDER